MLLSLRLSVLVPLQASLAYPSSLNSLPPGYAPWDEASMLLNTESSEIMPSQDEYSNFYGVEGMQFNVLIFRVMYR